MSDEASNADAKRTAKGPSQTQWQFIDASDNSRSTLTKVKRHVMQEYMRQKRQAAEQSGAEVEESASQSRDQGQKPRPPKRTIDRAKDTNVIRQLDKSHEMAAYVQRHILESSPDHPLEQPQLKEIVETHAIEDRVHPVPSPVFLTSYGDMPFRRQVFYSSPDILKTYSSLSQSSTSDISTPTPSSSAPTTPLEMTLSPKTILSAARTDPFNSLPLELDLEGQRLFDFYVNEMPACSYGNHFRSSKAHNWYTAVFVPEGMKGPVAFQNTILVHAANTWVWVRDEEPDETALYHRDRAITMLREHRERNPGDISDEAIIACLSAAGLEDFDPRPGHKQISWLHMRAAREMIRARGGPSAFENTRLGMLINWQDYILSGYETEGPSFFFEYDSPTSPQMTVPYYGQLNPNLISASGIAPYTMSFTEHHPLSPCEEIHNQCNEFINFLKRCEQLAVHQRKTLDLAMAPVRLTAFRQNSLLYQILAAPPGLRFTASGNRKQFVARLVALVMLNSGLWDYRSSVLYSEAFLRGLEQAVLDSEVNMSGSVEALLQIMLECDDASIKIPDTMCYLPLHGGNPDFTQYSPTAQTPYSRPWFAGRMLKVAKRLSFDTWMNVNYFLFSCLTLHPGIPSVSVWETDLRQEILNAPLTQYVMPSLHGQ
ncbi:sigma-70 region 2 family protein [Aspergillus sclerotioniger CBS 115572]|uniref:Sigma-70 region 2 family protein n=1 Tax=Aspergillus sclerotioniger CBS 115572 TaxID=1450535 RepID=A0A317WGV8_9EURO|nr:sigma-70 region 2 family protein [Aspergillus sclerotioniger CBS 115572]PWY84467.1 sigma-70 region 2 family protein [Aspergillus sclerotioniger CBS 115572]